MMPLVSNRTLGMTYIKVILLWCITIGSNTLFGQSISGRTTVCVGNNDNYTFNGPAGSKITSWQITKGTASGSGNSRLVNWTSAGTGQVKVNYRDSEGEPQPPATLSVTVNPGSGGVTPGAISVASTSVCNNSSTIIQSASSPTGNGFLTYYWFKRLPQHLFLLKFRAYSNAYTAVNLTESTTFYRQAVFQCTNVNSNTITLTVIPTQNFVVNISINPQRSSFDYCLGELSFTANTSHSGNIYYSWTHTNSETGTSAILSTSQTYTPVDFQSGDFVTVGPIFFQMLFV
ncbi:MAG: hypothetical protein IPJ20_19525 [Flammeovirgaceae bacterium]|nr:hypothetical protein [Flammeovirgaceae bacterium]